MFSFPRNVDNELKNFPSLVFILNINKIGSLLFVIITISFNDRFMQMFAVLEVKKKMLW